MSVSSAPNSSSKIPTFNIPVKSDTASLPTRYTRTCRPSQECPFSKTKPEDAARVSISASKHAAVDFSLFPSLDVARTTNKDGKHADHYGTRSVRTHTPKPRHLETDIDVMPRIPQSLESLLSGEGGDDKEHRVTLDEPRFLSVFPRF